MPLNDPILYLIIGGYDDLVKRAAPTLIQIGKWLTFNCVGCLHIRSDLNSIQLKENAIPLPITGALCLQNRTFIQMELKLALNALQSNRDNLAKA